MAPGWGSPVHGTTMDSRRRTANDPVVRTRTAGSFGENESPYGALTIAFQPAIESVPYRNCQSARVPYASQYSTAMAPCRRA